MDYINILAGYLYDFPFLDSECGLSVRNNRILGLHDHLINARRPTMALVGIPSHICPFPLFDRQVT